MIKKFIIAVTIASMMGLTGCYDNEEIDTLATVMAVGIEVAEASELSRYTFAVADTSGYSSDSKGDGASMKCFSQVSSDIKSAVEHINRKLSKRLSFSHLSAILFSKESAYSDMYDDVSYFEKTASVRPQALIAISDTNPSVYLEKLKPELESNPERYFQNIFQKTKGYVSSLRMCDFTNSYHCGTQTLAPVITAKSQEENISEDKSFVIGSALISKGRFIAEFTDNWVIGLFLGTKTVNYKGIRLKSTKTPDIKINIKDDIAAVDAQLYVKADGELDSKSASADIERFLKSAAVKACDVIDVKSAAKRMFYLQKSYDKYDWEQLLKNAEFDIKVNLVSGDLK